MSTCCASNANNSILLYFQQIELNILPADCTWLASIGSVSIGDKFPVRVMGIINVSSESFYKASVRTADKDIANAAREMQNSGADMIDIGAMSTAPYIDTLIPVEEETSRITRAIRLVKEVCQLPVSADTVRAAVAEQAIKAGADCINDVTGLKYDAKMASVVARSGRALIAGAYSQRVSTGKMSGTLKALAETLLIAKQARVQESKIIVDPSIGFFREQGRNSFFTKMTDIPWYIRDIEVLSGLGSLKKLSKPICISASRKSFIGHLLGLDRAEDRLVPSIVCETIATINGANIIRTHNVKETVQALTMLQLLC